MFVWYNLHHIDENESWNLSFYFSFWCIVWRGRTLSGVKCVAFLVLHYRKWFSTTWVWMCFPRKIVGNAFIWKMKPAENVSGEWWEIVIQWKPILSAVLSFFWLLLRFIWLPLCWIVYASLHLSMAILTANSSNAHVAGTSPYCSNSSLFYNE